VKAAWVPMPRTSRAETTSARPSPIALALLSWREAARVDRADPGRPSPESLAVHAPTDHVVVIPRAVDTPAHLVHDEHVDDGHGETGYVATGLGEELGLASLEVLRAEDGAQTGSLDTDLSILAEHFE
jgi:hypothetical protein